MLTKIQSYFIDYPAESRLWIFMADRELEENEVAFVKQNMDVFIPQWKAHGAEIEATYEWIENRFLVVVADETQTGASGCSIDALTRFIQAIEKELQLSFTNRMLVAYEEREELKLLPLAQFKQAVKTGEITTDAYIFNNSVSSLSDFWDLWKLPLDKSWAKSLL